MVAESLIFIEKGDIPFYFQVRKIIKCTFHDLLSLLYYHKTYSILILIPIKFICTQKI